MSAIQLKGRWGLFHKRALLSFDALSIEYRSGDKRLIVPRSEVSYGSIWMAYDRHDGDSELVLFRADRTAIARIPLSEFQHLCDLEATLGSILEIRSAFS